MRYVYAVLAGMAGAVLAAFVSAVIPGVANIYLTGHDIHWPSREFNWQFISMSLLDLLLVGISTLVLVGVFIATLKAQKPKS